MIYARVLPVPVYGYWELCELCAAVIGGYKIFDAEGMEQSPGSDDSRFVISFKILIEFRRKLDRLKVTHSFPTI